MKSYAPETIWAPNNESPYPITVGQHLLSQVGLFEPFVSKRRVLILSHPDISKHYASLVIATCQQAGAIDVSTTLLPSGESTKTLENAQAVWSLLLEKHYHRDTTLIALGGGVIGDLAGFVGACFLRGVPVIQCPTTLLSQVDSAIGGKTAVNHPLGKNMIGAFHPPVAVISDLSTLMTLGEREYLSGLAELLKYALILDVALYRWIQEHVGALRCRDVSILEQAVAWASRLKAKVVGQDEKERDHRMILNFGHTVGHAIESLLDYDGLLHGEAVAIGMVVATRLSHQQGTLPESAIDELINLLTNLGLPSHVPAGISLAQLWAKLKQDKKHQHGHIQWVLLTNVGSAQIGVELDKKSVDSALLRCGVKEDP